MAEKKVVEGLKWVKGEIAATLRPVRALVEADGVSAVPQDPTAAVQALEQVHGVLLALQLKAPARLAREMTLLAERMRDGLAGEDPADARSGTRAMGQALAQLNHHLDRLDAGFDESPRSLWPIIDAVRAACDVQPLTHAEQLSFAAADTNGASPGTPETLENLAEVVRQVRPQYHRYLVEWYRGDPNRQSLPRLGGLFHHLHDSLREGVLADLFRLAEVFTEALRNGALATDARARSLMGHLDRVLKALSQQPPQWPEVDALSLIDHLLRSLSEGGVNSPLIAQLQSLYDSSQSVTALPRADLEGLGGDEALAELARALLSEFAQLKEQFDRLARDAQTDRTALDAFCAHLRRLADTLDVAEVGNLPNRLRALATDFGALALDEIAEDQARLESHAMELLGIEAVLLAHADHRSTRPRQLIAPDMDLSELTAATLREAGYELVRVKDAIANCHVDQGIRETLNPVRQHLFSVSGALNILGEIPAARLAESIGELVQQRYVKAEHAPTDAEFEHLADAVAALELYIGHLQDAVPFGDSLIERGGQSIRALQSEPGDTLAPPIGEIANALSVSIDLDLDLDLDEALPLDATAPPDVPASGQEQPISDHGISEALPGLIESEFSDDDETEFLDIFMEEAREETASAQIQFARWESNPNDTAALASLRRSFHTLKGSGRLVGALQVAEFGQAVEFLLNRLIEDQALPSEEILACVAEAVNLLPELVTAESEGRPFDIDPLISRANRLRESANLVPGPEPMIDPGQPLSLDAPAGEALADQVTDHDSLFVADEELLRIFQAETHEHLAELRAFLRRAEAGDARVDEATQRALHTLTGSARMSGIDSIAVVTKGLEQCIKPLLALDGDLDDGLLTLIRRAVEGIRERVDELPNLGAGAAALVGLAEEIAQLAQPVIAGEKIDTPAASDALPAEIPPEPASEPMSAQAEAVLGEELEFLLADAEPDASAWGWLDEGEGETVEPEASFGETLPEALADTGDSDQLAGEIVEDAELAATVVATTQPLSAVLPGLREDVETPPPPVIDMTAASWPPSTTLLEAVEPSDAMPAPDPEMAGLFLEDARDLLDKLDTQFREWQFAPENIGALDGINRLLHTLKGSARLTGVAAIGDLSHALETRLKALSEEPGAVNDTTMELAQRAVDTLSAQIDALEQGAPIPRMSGLIEALGQAPLEMLDAPVPFPVSPTPEPFADLANMREEALQTGAEAPAPSGVEGPVLSGVEGPVPSGVEGPVPSGVEGPVPSGVEGAVAVPVSPQIRVRSDLLNRLVNHAGEISIYRGRLSQRNGLLGFGLGEFDQTVARLREQLRLLEIETQTQIMHRVEREGDVSDYNREFDPLEMDRFSRLQQLSGSLAETVNDLVSIKDMLGGYQREFTDLLTQQARLADDLQDGLLRTRLVPFVQVVPRLHRLVRQTADTLGKSARLEVIGPEVELDRTILDRLVAPLEHLLRNAVDHGLEDSKTRTANGKPATGKVTLALRREGNDAVISLSDDGKGMDLAAIRQQAIARGLLAPQTILPDEALLQFILEPGFTTSGKVTQISGRGVGLDVVASEIKVANGSIALESVPGQGARFTVRLPLTLAIIEAFLVSAGDNIYAVPHSTVEAAGRIGRDDLLAIYRGEATEFTSRGHSYKVVYLGGVLDPAQEPDIGERRWLPLLMIRLGEQRVALHVDSLLESQRILVKPLGPQLAGVRWLSGGTILPDGRVALILDALALLRSGAAQLYRPAAAAVETTKGPLCVMVVDDSLTVRRVTSRLLRRQNMEVLTAKDGVEALTLLDERMPDLLLLDIEMPRMDGYELARHIRRSEGLRDLPIIMITSRTGAKHREYAMQLGVDRYLGKPYQESELLNEINSLLAERAG
ncbi:Hpt domain-containing protein [Thiocystis violascens]|uniref:Chemotaxis protein CheA n=1 Tax=Thiocystis violascens (strain ATCC 17096 / DSM 198 / 6111) TaxID=765911 RepID=I3YDV8_THIV6|nr:Hpt domain-containing protein [Thiocystis violascens]AFL75176.1 chemotaxis protein histidine kinase-like protein [Thiocystis violascens DSM 198]